MTTKLLTTFKQKIKDFRLIPSSGGAFEVTINNELVYSKLKTGQFPDEQSIVNTATSKLGSK